MGVRGLRRFAFGWSRFGAFSAAGREVGPVDPFWVFLAPGHFAAKTPADECWIVLDFLGFSRPNLDFSMGYEAFSGKNFSLSSSAGAETPIDRLPVDQAVQQVQDMGLGRGAGLQSQFDGGEHGLLVVLENQGEDLDHLAVAARRLEHTLL